MGINSQGVAYNFGQLGSAFMGTDHNTALTPPDGMVITAITMVGVDIVFDELKVDTSKNSLVYSGTETNNTYFGMVNANTGGNGEAVVNDGTPVFPAGLTIYGRWTEISLQAQDLDGGIIAYFGY